MKMVMGMLVVFLVTGAFSKKIDFWTLAILFVGILGVLFITRITF